MRIGRLAVNKCLTGNDMSRMEYIFTERLVFVAQSALLTLSLFQAKLIKKKKKKKGKKLSSKILYVCTKIGAQEGENIACNRGPHSPVSQYISFFAIESAIRKINIMLCKLKLVHEARRGAALIIRFHCIYLSLFHCSQRDFIEPENLPASSQSSRMHTIDS